MEKPINRLRINIENKIEVLNEAISMTYRILNGGSVTVTGLHTMSFSRKDGTCDSQIISTIEKFEREKENLVVRLGRFKN